MTGRQEGGPGHYKQAHIAIFAEDCPAKGDVSGSFGTVGNVVLAVIIFQRLLDDFIKPQVFIRSDAAQNVVGFAAQLHVELMHAIGMVPGVRDP